MCIYNSGTVWSIANQTAPGCAVMGTLHDGVNISVCEIKASGQFSQTRSHISITPAFRNPPKMLARVAAFKNDSRKTA